MNSETTLINRVAESDLQTIALDEMIRDAVVVSFDLKDYLFQGLILKEKDFRESLKATDWTLYQDKIVAVHCSTDAIIPMWAYMLVAAYSAPVAKAVYHGDEQAVFEQVLLDRIKQKDWEYLRGKRVVIKGCSDKELPASAYLEISSRLQPLVQSIMYGEPCSTVPIFKRPRVV